MPPAPPAPGQSSLVRRHGCGAAACTKKVKHRSACASEHRPFRSLVRPAELIGLTRHPLVECMRLHSHSACGCLSARRLPGDGSGSGGGCAPRGLVSGGADAAAGARVRGVASGGRRHQCRAQRPPRTRRLRRRAAAAAGGGLRWRGPRGGGICRLPDHHGVPGAAGRCAGGGFRGPAGAGD
jgi:hypothetical protein